ncbi:MAG: glycosyltransferase family 2 protein [Candidatus Electrothrix sp. AUS1_2]|nr:glycosyltransferase family 2 protein [Candidatus Electrothrix sp. AUS1_2]
MNKYQGISNKKTWIILVNFNNHADTLRCISSIKKAGYSDNIIVVDNNSTKKGIDDICKKFPNIHLIKNPRNVGFGKANNIGIKWALDNTNCEYIFLLNNDTLIKEDTIPILERGLLMRKDIALTAPKILLIDQPDTLWYGGGEIDWKKCTASLPGYLGPANNELVCRPRLVSFASGCAMLFKRSALSESGGFDERFFMYIEDLELCIRIARSNQKIYYVPDAIVYHKGQGSQRKDEKFYPIEHPKNPNLSFYIYHLTKNKLLVIRQHATIANKMKFYFFFSLRMLIKCLQYIFHKRLDAVKAFLKGFVDSFDEKYSK